MHLSDESSATLKAWSEVCKSLESAYSNSNHFDAEKGKSLEQVAASIKQLQEDMVLLEACKTLEKTCWLIRALIPSDETSEEGAFDGKQKIGFVRI